MRKVKPEPANHRPKELRKNLIGLEEMLQPTRTMQDRGMDNVDSSM